MPIVRETLQDPTDLVIPGEIRGDLLVPTIDKANPIWLPRANAGVSTGSGLFVSTAGRVSFAPQGSDEVFVLSGTTLDSAGDPLATCRVLVFEYARIALGESPLVAETVSDGSGAWSVVVPKNTLYQIVCHKVDATELAGASAIVTP